jgi:hypothetical protein
LEKKVAAAKAVASAQHAAATAAQTFDETMERKRRCDDEMQSATSKIQRIKEAAAILDEPCPSVPASAIPEEAKASDVACSAVCSLAAMSAVIPAPETLVDATGADTPMVEVASEAAEAPAIDGAPAAHATGATRGAETNGQRPVAFLCPADGVGTAFAAFQHPVNVLRRKRRLNQGRG